MHGHSCGQKDGSCNLFAIIVLVTMSDRETTG